LAKLGVESFRPQRAIIGVLKRYRHLLAGAINYDMPKKLHAVAGRQILALLLCRRLHVNQLRTKGIVERIGTKVAGMNRARDEFPERLEILKCRLVGVIIMGGGVVHIRRDPNGVAYGRALDERK